MRVRKTPFEWFFEELHKQATFMVAAAKLHVL